MLITPTTRPSASKSGLPLLPGSIGIATCTIFRPAISRSTAATTPRAALNSNPSGLPTAPTSDELRGLTELERIETIRIDLEDCQIERLIGREHANRLVGLTAGELDDERTATSDHVEVGHDPPFAPQNEVAAESTAAADSIARAHDDDRAAHTSDQRLEGLGIFVGRSRARWRGDGSGQESERDELGHGRVLAP
jgi:hypothetical protein